MANKLIREMGLPQSIANIFTARNILTAKDALSLTEFELMELLDVGLEEVTAAIAHISETVCPPYQTVISLLKNRLENSLGYIPTQLKGLDNALCGGVPAGALTELVGPAGIGKTQFCLKLSILASLPSGREGFKGRVVYIDTESKFSSRRLMEIGANSFPQIFCVTGKAQEMAGRIIVLQPTSFSEFTERLQQIKLLVLQQEVELLIIDSIAALVSLEYEKDKGANRQHTLGWHVSFLKSLAELSRVPIVVTNQVRAHGYDDSFHYFFEEQNKDKTRKVPERLESRLTAALGFNWAHAVTIRLVLEAHSGQRFIKVAKSPFSPPVAFPFTITSSGISLLEDDGVEILGPEIHSIRWQGCSELGYGQSLQGQDHASM